MDDVNIKEDIFVSKLSKRCLQFLGNFKVYIDEDFVRLKTTSGFSYHATSIDGLLSIVEMCYRDKMIERLISAIIPKTKICNQLRILFNDYAELILTLPASVGTHNAFTGGWYSHTESVISAAVDLSNKYCRYNEEYKASLLFCALVHDLGKLGTPDQPGYILFPGEKEGDEQVWKHNPHYDNKMTHELRTIHILNKYNVPLTDEEFAAIVYHGGLYNHSLHTFAKIEKGLPLLLHTADNLSAKLLEERG